MDNEFFYKIYCNIHRLSKILLLKKRKSLFRMVSFNASDFSENEDIKINGSHINDIEIDAPTYINKRNLFPVENIVANFSNINLKDSFILKKNNSRLSIGLSIEDAKIAWEIFLNTSIIAKGFKNEGLHYTGYIADGINEWCLPSWIWTNAAIVRMHCNYGKIKNALRISDLLLNQQLDCGGWIVRNDYKAEGAIPTLAPNDSAYIANNAFIEIYKLTNKPIYLNAAKKCADWIIETARPDGLVWSGYDMKNKNWVKDYVIVDIGFTAALFANLYDITLEKKYKIFLEKFVSQYLKLFFNPINKGFCTSINKHNKQVGGMFTRGQAWALEGLIPAYRVLKNKELKQIIDVTISNLLEKQLQNGGWAYNLSKSLLGEDCKGVSVIAKNLMEWNLFEQNEKVFLSAQKALDWCVNRTASKGDCKGGIFSFCMEGAVVHNFYTKTAFIYASSYAIELHEMLKKKK